MESKRRQLMYAIQMYDFYLYELQLYLDTHPTCQNGLYAFKKYKELREKAIQSYNEMFGPLTPGQSSCDGVYEWVKEPWPWEKEEN